MKRFIKYMILFSIPVLIFLIAAEIYSRTQTIFVIKKEHFENNLSTINTLILGSSHLQNGLNPAFIRSNSCNMAYGGQPISIDYFLLNKYIDQMKNLKTVLFEVSPHRFYYEFDPSSWNGHVYSNLYDINYKTEKLSIKNHSLVLSDVKYFSTIFVDNCNPTLPKPKLNTFGFMTNAFPGRFTELENDSIKINQTFKLNSIFDNQENFKLNMIFMNKIIKECQKKKVKIIFIGSPLYQTYYSKIPLKAKIQVENSLHHLTNKYGIQYYDFSRSKRFYLKDYINDNHLNPIGAKKFTIIIDSILTN
jgi:hypothetical protein